MITPTTPDTTPDRQTRLLRGYIDAHGGTEAVRMATQYFAGQTMAEVARDFKCSPSTAHARIHKIKAALDRVGYCPPSWKLRDRVHSGFAE